MNPADPERFRTEYRRQRWYIDPLPGCDIAPATDAKWPSVTTVKKVWAGEFYKKLPGTDTVVPLDAYRAAEYALDNLDAIAALERPAALELICTQPRRDLNAAAARGTDIHTVIEDLCAGREPDTLLNPDAEPYLPAAHAAVAALAPEIVYAETVVIGRGSDELGGWGGTFDALAWVTIDGERRLYVCDWKTRSSKHGVYLEEAAQLAGYVRADYLIADVEGEAMRLPIPTDIAGGLVVSIGADRTFEVYPVDLDHGWECFRLMRQAWDLKRTGQSAGRKALGDALHPGALAGKTGAEAVAAVFGDVEDVTTLWLLERIDAIKAAGHIATLVKLWPTGVAAPKAVTAGDAAWSEADHAAVLVAVQQTEAEHRMPFSDLNVPPGTPPIEPATIAPPAEPDPDGDEHITQDDLDVFRSRYQALPKDLAAGVLEAAHAVGVRRMGTHVRWRVYARILDALEAAEAAAAADAA